MKILHTTLSTTCLIAGLLFTAAHASNSVVVTTLTDYSPFTFGVDSSVKNEIVSPGQDSSTLKGYDWDILRASYHAVGVSIDLSVVPWPRGIRLLESGGTDILFPTTKTTIRVEKGYHFSDKPVHMTKNMLYVKADSNMQWDGSIDTLSSVLKGKVVGVRRDFSYGQLWDANVESLGARILEADSDDQLYKMLRAGRLDVVVAYDIPADYLLEQEGLTDFFKKIGNVGTSTEYVATHGKNGSIDAVKQFDKGFALITENGKLQEIRTKWGQ